MPNQQNGVLSQVDMPTVVHVVIIGLVLLIGYHLLFHR